MEEQGLTKFLKPSDWFDFVPLKKLNSPPLLVSAAY
jgi:hypothetical protein